MTNSSHKGLLILLAIFFALFVSGSLSAQEYARYYYVWDKYRGVWYCSENTTVRVTRDDGEEMMVSITYNGIEYEDCLWCATATYATAMNLTVKSTGRDSGFTADLTISSSGLLTVNLYRSDSNTPFYQSALHRRYR